jgi:hypothetical protein
VGESNLTPEEYERWVPMEDARSLLPWDVRKSRRWIASRLATGELKASARLIISETRYEATNEAYALVPKIAWSDWSSAARQGDEWDTGDCTLVIRGGYSESVVLLCREIRFDPEPFARFAGEVGALGLEAREQGTEPTPTNETSTSKLPKLPQLAEAEARRFARLYLEIWSESAVETKALTAARACYPANSIGRDWFYAIFRELRGPGKRGNPAFRGQPPANE